MAALGCVSALAFGVTACGSDDDGGGGGGGGGKKVTIYSSLPLQGTSRPQNLDVIKGMKLALSQNGNKGGDCTVTFKSLDDAKSTEHLRELGIDLTAVRGDAGIR